MGGEELRKHEGSFTEEEDEEEVELLPGFRFHPTDEELVGFYLRRQLDKKPIKIELIKQIDIYQGAEADRTHQAEAEAAMGGEELRKHEGSFTEEDDDEEEVELPGFRFNPTDEELVGFYLRRQLDKKPIKIELIKQIDIYQYDPWDLPKASCSGGEKEWYFFCKRGRKFGNSIRPNRVTGSGFWKATRIDKPIAGQGGECIGLKKTLVYYRGGAGKGTKTDWMMHEFRLPSLHDSAGPTNATNPTIAQQAEIWTLCRIFKRNVPPSWKHITDWRSSSSSHTKRQYSSVDKNASSTDEIDHTSNYYSNDKEAYIDFGGSHNHNHLGHHYYSQLNHHHESMCFDGYQNHKDSDVYVETVKDQSASYHGPTESNNPSLKHYTQATGFESGQYRYLWSPQDWLMHPSLYCKYMERYLYMPLEVDSAASLSSPEPPYGEVNGVDPYLLEIVEQIEYYFSYDNLIHDVNFREHMNYYEGWVSLPFIASLTEVRKLTLNVKVIEEALKTLSFLIEIKDGTKLIRHRRSWQRWKPYI